MAFTARVEAWDESREIRFNSTTLMTRVAQSMRIRGDFKSSRVTLEIVAYGGMTRFGPTRAIMRSQLNRTSEILLGSLKTKLEAGKDDFLRPPPSLDNPFEGNVKLPSRRTGIDD